MNAPARPILRSPATWLLVLIFVADFSLFDHFGSRRVTGIYPRWNDQIQYLSECYTGYEYTRAHGLFAGLWHTLTNPSAQGTLHDFAAVIEFQFVGASRSAALALNMFALIAWQAALFTVVRSRCGSSAMAILAALLPLALRGPWENVPGSAYDFRLDHLAMCALGVTSALAVATDRFRHRGWSIAFGVAAGVTLLTRFITGTYFVVIFLSLLLWVGLRQNAAGTDSSQMADSGGGSRARLPSLPRSRQFANLGLAAAIATALALPIFWLNREWVWNYYYIGHYVGPESAIRNQNFGLLRSLRYVFGWLGERHLGWFFAWFATGVAVALGSLAIIFRRGLPRPEGNPAARFASQAFTNGMIFLLSPALVLTLHPQKSEVVLGALAPGVVLLIISLWSMFGSRFRSPAVEQEFPTAPAAPHRPMPDRARCFTGIIAAVATLTALGYFARRQTVTFESPEAMAAFRQVNALADYVVVQADAAQFPVIRVAVDYITDALDAQVLRVICYERHHVWKDWDMKLPTGIAEPDPAVVRQRIADSDFIFLTEKGDGDRFPYDRTLSAMRPELTQWCSAHLTRTRQFTLNQRTMALYERRQAAK